MDTDKVYSKFTGTKKDGTVINLRIVPIQEKHGKDFLDLYVNHFIKEESTFRASGIPKSAKALQEFRQSATKKLIGESFKMVVCCLDNGEDTDTVVGGSIMQLTTAEEYGQEMVKMIPKTEEQKKLFQVYGDMVNSYEVIKAFKMEKYFIDRGVVVHPDYRGLGIAQELFKVRRMQCKEHGIPIHGAWMTSYGTQKAGERDGWITVYEIDYQELGAKHDVTFKKGPPSCKYMIARIDLD
ncbi:unnamed protein product [Chrysodeixis includens]|uniref:N-acetyltransferase domain-containing protein n=1 Tax=Chrysodeixis includens TaxID=689277 RepID=A0A9P0FPD5_CHRIL|nr:unnamed protein product [Chrysodeixis includens]